MLASHKVMAFVAVTDPARARAFYEGILGLRFVSDGPHALVFDAGGTMLRAQKVNETAGAPYTVLGWQVPDIAAVVAGLGEKGVRFERYGFLEQDASGVWTTPGGSKVAWFKDPDGNLLSLTQLVG